MQTSLSIMAHPKRRSEALALEEKLQKYQFKELNITWDKKNNEWDTGERALRAGIKAGCDWHLVLQDDAIIPDDFYKHVSNAIKFVPTKSLISLYTGKARPLKKRITVAVSKSRYCSWLKSDLLFWGVGIIIPTSHIEPMLEYAETRTEQYDTRIGIFYQRNMLPVYYTMPSLVDHDDNLGSLLNHGQAPERRVAHKFIDGPISWNKDVVDI